MKYPLRTLGQIAHLHKASGGKLRADVIAVCDTCGTKWSVNLGKAIEEIGAEATDTDLAGRLNCQTCSGGVCLENQGVPYLVIDDTPLGRMHWGFGHVDRYLDNIDALATEKPKRRQR